LEIDFDLVAQRLLVRTSDAPDTGFALEPMSVASFYRRFMAALESVGVKVSINVMPNEVPDPIRFPDDEEHAAYDAPAAYAFWRALVRVDRVFGLFRTAFVGKASPVHLFWGSFDLAGTRESYSHEAASAGFWPGSDAYPHAAFYSYVYPSPQGFAEAKIEPGQATWAAAMGEWLLPYDAVRTAADPDATLLRFLETTYRSAADLGHWDHNLDCAIGVAGRPRSV